jgi:hypothetical protein
VVPWTGLPWKSTFAEPERALLKAKKTFGDNAASSRVSSGTVTARRWPIIWCESWSKSRRSASPASRGCGET